MLNVFSSLLGLRFPNWEGAFETKMELAKMISMCPKLLVAKGLMRASSEDHSKSLQIAGE